MAVYVDPLFYATPRNSSARSLGRRWCHLTADSLDELHDFAKSIGLKQQWFQNHRFMPHYDLTPSKRLLAITKGAVEITTTEAGVRVRNKRLASKNTSRQ